MKKKRQNIIQLNLVVVGVFLATLFLAGAALGNVVLEEHFENNDNNYPAVRDWQYPDTNGTGFAIDDDDNPGSGDLTANCADATLNDPDTPQTEEYTPGTYSSISIDVDLQESRNSQLEFRYKVGGEESFDYGWVEIEDTAISPPIVKYYYGDINGRDVPYDGYSTPYDEDNALQWQNEMIDISEFDYRTIKLTFRFISGDLDTWNDADEYRGFYVDDVKITGTSTQNGPLPPTNPFPTNDGIDIPLTTDLSWQCPGDNTREVQVKFGTSPSPQTVVKDFGSGVFYSLTNAEIVAALGHELEGNTTYYWTVTVMNTDVSPALISYRTFRFTTACTPYKNFPYTEGFEDDWTNAPPAPPCWTQKENQQADNYWEVINVEPYSGDRCALGPPNNPGGGVQKLITPSFIMSSDAFRMSFWLKGSASSPTEGTDLHVIIGKIDAAGDFIAFPDAQQNYIAADLVSPPDKYMPTEWEEQTIDLSAFSGPNYGGEPVSILFELEDREGLGLYIDEVSVYEVHDKDSSVAPGDASEPSTILSSVDAKSERFNVFDFKLVDNGGGDGESSEVRKLTVTQGAANEIDDWRTAIAGAMLYGPDGEWQGVVNADNIVFEYENFIYINDGQSETYQLRIWLREDLSGISDKAQLAFELTHDNVVTEIISSRFGAGSADSGGIAIDIQATRLVFIVEPHYNAVQNELLYIAPVVAAQDDNGNIDMDYSGEIYLTNSSGLGMLDNVATAVDGLATFSSFKFTETGGKTQLVTTNSDGLVNGQTTTLILVTDPPTIIQTFEFETDEGWSLVDEFEVDVPSGKGGSSGHPDPVNAYAGSQVLGTDLTGLNANKGDCEPDLADKAYTATSPVIDCSDHARVGLMFYRWLNTQTTDHAYIEVFDGTSWHEIYASDNEAKRYKLTQDALDKLETDIDDDEIFDALQLLLAPLKDVVYANEEDFNEAIYALATNQDDTDLIDANISSILLYAGYIFEDAWSFHEFDISEYADGNDQVQIRFSYGASDSAGFYSGWNIDQLQIIERPIEDDMEYDYSVVEQDETGYVVQGWQNQEIIKVKVITNHTANPMTLSELNFNIHGTSEYTDIEQAKVFYTGLDDAFSTDQLFGSAAVPAGGAFTVSGSQELQGGANYFWLAFDVDPDAIIGHYLDGECLGVTINSTNYGTNVYTAPGDRIILRNPVLADVIHILMVLTGYEVTPSFDIMLLDYTANGKIDMGDAIFVLEFLAELRDF